MCDGPKCAFCEVPIAEERRTDIVILTSDGRRIEPALAKRDFTVVRDQDMKIYHPTNRDVFVHKGECDQKLAAASRVRIGAA